MVVPKLRHHLCQILFKGQFLRTYEVDNTALGTTFSSENVTPCLGKRLLKNYKGKEKSAMYWDLDLLMFLGYSRGKVTIELADHLLVSQVTLFQMPLSLMNMQR